MSYALTQWGKYLVPIIDPNSDKITDIKIGSMVQKLPTIDELRHNMPEFEPTEIQEAIERFAQTFGYIPLIKEKTPEKPGMNCAYIKNGNSSDFLGFSQLESGLIVPQDVAKESGLPHEEYKPPTLPMTWFVRTDG